MKLARAWVAPSGNTIESKIADVDNLWRKRDNNIDSM